MPAILQANLLFDLEWLPIVGLTYFSPGKVKFYADNRFHLKSRRGTGQLRFIDGTIVDGFLPSSETQPKVIHLERIAEIIDGKPNRVSPPIEEGDPYIFISENWVQEQLQGPFIKKAYGKERISKAIDTVSTTQSSVRQMFYQNLEQINYYWKHKKIFGYTLPFQNTDFQNDNGSIFIFDATTWSKNDTPRLDQVLRKFEGVEKPFVIINFLDRLCPKSLAQAAFMNQIVYNVTEHWMDVNIAVLNVVVRNEQGVELYQKELEQYFKQTPASWDETPKPFTMFLFRPHVWPEDGVKSLQLGTLQRMDFDLFHGCDGDLTEEERNQRFRLNRDRIMHEMFGMAGKMANQVRMEVKDFRDKNGNELREIIDELRQQAVVIRVSSGEQKDFLAALYSCGRLTELGMPHTVVLRTDKDKDDTPDVAIYDRSYPYALSAFESVEDYLDVSSSAKAHYLCHILKPLYLNHLSIIEFSGDRGCERLEKMLRQSVVDLFGDKPFVISEAQLVHSDTKFNRGVD